MGAEPFLLASSIVGVLAQRLVRLLCIHCRTERRIDDGLAARLELESSDVIVFSANGCEQCHQTGFRGRTAIYELVVFDDKTRELVHDGASEQALESHARANSTSIMQNGIDAVIAGKTTPEELLRVMQSV